MPGRTRLILLVVLVAAQGGALAQEVQPDSASARPPAVDTAALRARAMALRARPEIAAWVAPALDSLRCAVHPIAGARLGRTERVLLDDLVAVLDSLSEPTRAAAVRCVAGVLEVHAPQRDLGRADSLLSQALEVARIAPVPGVIRASAWSLGHAAYAGGQWSRARELFQVALDFTGSHERPEDHWWLQLELAHALFASAAVDTAETHLQRLMEDTLAPRAARITARVMLARIWTGYARVQPAQSLLAAGEPYADGYRAILHQFALYESRLSSGEDNKQAGDLGRRVRDLLTLPRGQSCLALDRRQADSVVVLLLIARRLRIRDPRPCAPDSVVVALALGMWQHAVGGDAVRALEDARSGLDLPGTDLPKVETMFGRADSLARRERNALVAVSARLGLALTLARRPSESSCRRSLQLARESAGELLRLSRLSLEGIRLRFVERHGDVFAGWVGVAVACANAGGSGGALSALVAAEAGRANELRLRRRLAGRAVAAPADAVVIPTEDSVRRWVAEVRGAGRGLLYYYASASSLHVWWATPSRPLQMRSLAVGRCQLLGVVQAARQQLGVASEQLRARVRSPLVVEALRGRSAVSLDCPGADAGIGSPSVADVILPREAASALAEIPEVIVMAHGPLNMLPFAALALGGRPAGAFPATWFAPSLEMAVRAMGPDPGRGASDVVVLANPRMPAGFQPLPGAASEGRRVGELLGARPRSGARATEESFRSTAPRANLVHLATHGLSFGTVQESGRSFIVLAADGATNDGLLTAGEIARMPLGHVDLVVLSACQTGLGAVTMTEGTLGLAWSFLNAGARTVVVSLWNVSDQATALLMEAFYQHLLRDRDRPGYAVALRRAQDDLRRVPRFRSPEYWAAFQVVAGR